MDVVVEFEARAKLSLWDVAEIQERLAELVGRPVDRRARRSSQPVPPQGDSPNQPPRLCGLMSKTRPTSGICWRPPEPFDASRPESPFAEYETRVPNTFSPSHERGGSAGFQSEA